ncbi:MAG: hypothetical protein A2790_12095 [Phenylobacterium sp. RIFCSPHIGHO2_01_FULL_69_31]|uniref:hypothetical protein n=1 Tax=Phenylobacterium sp. RIFCSPHIGHO2_01_FULL_69_31 TaxID=1801944 RepID=UPI0008D034AE|nr:hypothetical protein [Phenylobacterium sp. RIFCSPHIGHO2_01_FULL_69_31]OHB28152.1 MAG: hypothetical protein A2790_12095 [Phenylobacterium sp. RIFCSPHIGHO2_01_FULL_69_31]
MSPALRAVLLGMMGQSGPVEFASAAATTGAGAATDVTLSKPTGVEVGDFVAVLVPDTLATASISTTGGATWSRSYQAASGNRDGAVLCWKVLTATDVSNAWVLSHLGALAVAFRYHGYGALSAAVRSSDANTSSSLTLSGFGKDVRTYGTLSFLRAQGSPTAVLPSGFAARYDQLQGATRIVAADNNGGYVDGASVTWAGLATGNGSAAFLVEVMGE